MPKCRPTAALGMRHDRRVHVSSGAESADESSAIKRGSLAMRPYHRTRRLHCGRRRESQSRRQRARHAARPISATPRSRASCMPIGVGRLRVVGRNVHGVARSILTESAALPQYCCVFGRSDRTSYFRRTPSPRRADLAPRRGRASGIQVEPSARLLSSSGVVAFDGRRRH
jgi:hypothetical protein